MIAEHEDEGARARRWSRTNLLIMQAAARLGAKAEPLSRARTDFFLRLRGEGRSVIISKTRSPFLTQVAQTLSNNKKVSRELLAAIGLPVPPDLLLDEGDDPRGAAAQGFLRRFGAVVVKPNWGNRGVGVTPGIREMEGLVRAISRAQAIDRDEEALLEPHLEGTNVRLTVIGGRCVAAAEIVRPLLRGDGVTSAAAAIAALNEDPRRGSWSAPALVAMDVIEAEEAMEAHLEALGLGMEEPLPVGAAIEITSEEAEVIDRSEEIDRGWFEVAEAACARLGVDVGGVDLRGPLASFVRAPRAGADAWREAAILEVNALPALHYHALPTVGAPRPVFEAFVAYCLSLPGAPGPCAEVGAAADVTALNSG
jgi:D-alanine-D-alanine ligase-like ATP-grasp enzyme